jgi:chromosomal replication initiation ATPase DnaA
MEYTLADHIATVNAETESKYLDSLHYTHEYVRKVIASAYGLQVEDISKRTRKRPLPEARFLIDFAMAIPMEDAPSSKRWLHWSLMQMSELVQRDHATILHGIKSITGFIIVDKVRREKYQRIFSEMYADGYRYPLKRFNEIVESNKTY